MELPPRASWASSVVYMGETDVDDGGRDHSISPTRVPWTAAVQDPLEYSPISRNNEQSVDFGIIPHTNRTCAFSTDASLLAAQELSSISEALKAKSDRIAQKEAAAHQAEVSLASATGRLKARLVAECEALLSAARIDLRRETACHRRRLEDLLERAHGEFQRVVAWRRETKAMQEALAARFDEQRRVSQRLHDVQRRCSLLAEREKAQKKILDEERARWEQERCRLETLLVRLRIEPSSAANDNRVRSEGSCRFNEPQRKQIGVGHTLRRVHCAGSTAPCPHCGGRGKREAPRHNITSSVFPVDRTPLEADHCQLSNAGEREREEGHFGFDGDKQRLLSLGLRRLHLAAEDQDSIESEAFGCLRDSTSVSACSFRGPAANLLLLGAWQCLEERDGLLSGSMANNAGDRGNKLPRSFWRYAAILADHAPRLPCVPATFRGKALGASLEDGLEDVQDNELSFPGLGLSLLEGLSWRLLVQDSWQAWNRAASDFQMKSHGMQQREVEVYHKASTTGEERGRRGATGRRCGGVERGRVQRRGGAGEGETDLPKGEIEHNALAWARRQRGNLHISAIESPSGDLDDERSACEDEDLPSAPRVDPLDVGGRFYDGYPNEAITLLPAAAQKSLAASLWRIARSQLLDLEPALRGGFVAPPALRETGRALLVVAVLSFSCEPSHAVSAIRALLHLCAEHAAVLCEQMSDSLPVLLWLADATGALIDPTPRTGGASELVMALLCAFFKPCFAHNSIGGNGEAGVASLTILTLALLRSTPRAAAIEPLMKMLELVVVDIVGRRGVGVDRLPRGLLWALRQWLKRLLSHPIKTSGVTSAARALEGALYALPESTLAD